MKPRTIVKDPTPTKRPRHLILIRCLKLIQRRSGNVKEEAKRHHTDPRTIFRDLLAIRESGVKIKIVGGRRAAWYVIEDDILKGTK